MPRFAANITFLFTELPFLDRFEAARAAGFRGVEFHYPYAEDPAEVLRRLREYRLAPVLMNIRAGDHAKGEWGFAGVPGREATFRLCVTEAIEYAVRIGCGQLNCLAGVPPAGAARKDCERLLVENVRHAAVEFERAGLTLNLEALNTRDVPGFLLSNTHDTMRLINEVGHLNVMLQYDWYHMHIMEGTRAGALADTMRLLLPVIGHMQFADAPGRHEPGSGQIDFPALFRHVDAIGYEGWVSAEYRPRGATLQSLDWMTPAA